MIHSQYEDFDLYDYFTNIVKQIPEGKVTSYAVISRALGDPAAALACAYMQMVQRNDTDAPLHRVIRAGGEIAGYNDLNGIKSDSALLRGEGLTVSSGKVKFVSEAMFTDFDTDFPLESMREEQNRLSEDVSLEDDFDADLLSAVDVSYLKKSGFASMVYVEDGEDIVRNNVMDATFPYIPGYLFYREYRFVKKLAEKFGG